MNVVDKFNEGIEERVANFITEKIIKANKESSELVCEVVFTYKEVVEYYGFDINEMRNCYTYKKDKDEFDEYIEKEIVLELKEEYVEKLTGKRK